ncbi:hypothetical protein [Thalassobaculum sp.]|uniref:hypothetical protein n=1 Tax=Thalassobaculum sp. TaxID=2022740 RepID=UPI0032EE8B8F
MTALDHMPKMIKTDLRQRGYPHVVALVGVNDFRRAELRQRVLQDLDVELGIHSVRPPPRTGM